MLTNLHPNLIAALLAAFLWGIAWALCLQRTKWGQRLVSRRTWVTVVIGVGVNLLIALLVLPLDRWFALAGIMFVSSIGIIGRSIVNELKEEEQAEQDLGAL